MLKRADQRERRNPFYRIGLASAFSQASKGCTEACCGQEVKELGDVSPLEKEKAEDEKVRIEVVVDSGAVDHVIPESAAPMFTIQETEVSRNGMYYVAANGGKIYNNGIKDVKGQTNSGINAVMRFQVAKVTKALGAVKKICAAGNRVVFDDAGSYIEDKGSGIKTKIREDSGRCLLDLFVDAIGDSSNPIGNTDFVGLEELI